MTTKKIQEIINSQNLYDFTDKAGNIKNHILYMFMRTQSMFEWSGLPDTIPQEYLEQFLQICGVCAIIPDDSGNLYAMQGGLGGEPDAYYQPSLFTYANPYLNMSGSLKIGEECAIIKNDTFYLGLVPLFKKYASQLAENELSLNMSSINSRLQMILTATDDRTKEACEKYLEDLFNGKLSALLDDGFLDNGTHSIPMTSTSQTGMIGDLIEYEQYLKASWFNEIGLNANYNMKREALNSAESSINDDILFPLADEMLKQRQEGAERVNALFGTDISVELASSWSDNKKEEESIIEEIDDQDGEQDDQDSEEVKEDVISDTN